MVDFSKPCEINGRPVRILCTDRPGDCPVIAMDERLGLIYTRKADGYGGGGAPIVNTVKRESKFVYIWGDDSIGNDYYLIDTVEAARDRINARSALSPHYRAIKKILEVKFEDGVPVSSEFHDVS